MTNVPPQPPPTQHVARTQHVQNHANSPAGRPALDLSTASITPFGMPLPPGSIRILLTPSNSVLIHFFSLASLHTLVQAERYPTPMPLSRLLVDLEVRHPGISGLWRGGYDGRALRTKVGVGLREKGGARAGVLLVVGKREFIFLGGGAEPVQDRLFRAGETIALIPGVEVPRGLIREKRR